LDEKGLGISRSSSYRFISKYRGASKYLNGAVHEFQQLRMKKETYDIQMPRMMAGGKEYMYTHRFYTQRAKSDMRQDKNLVKAIYIVLPIIKHQIRYGS
jgi:bisphosphoglycerate-dependent phosphoglycerate mutase